MTTPIPGPFHARNASKERTNGVDDFSTFDRRQQQHFTDLLREKWDCPDPEHSVCVLTEDGQHFQLSDVDIARWVKELCRGTATTADPPDQMFESINNGAVWNHTTGEMKVKAVSITPSRRREMIRSPKQSPSPYSSSVSDGTTITSKTGRFRFTSGSSKSETATVTSGALGPGYFSGKALQLLGEMSLGVVEDAFIMMRGNSHRDCLAKWRKRDIMRPQLGEEERTKVLEMLEDALEMTRQCYPQKVNKMAYSIGRDIQHWLQAYPDIPKTRQTSVWLIQVQICLIPLLLSQISRHDPLAGDLAHRTLSALTDVPLTVQGIEKHAEVIQLLGRALAYSKCTHQHSWLGVALLRIIQMSRCLRPLTEGELRAIKELAVRRMEKQETDSSLSRPWEVPLFAQCVAQEPRFRDDVLGPTGLHTLLRALGRLTPRDPPDEDVEWENVALILRALAFLSEHDWVAAAVSEGIVGSLINVFRPRVPERWFCTRFWAMDTLRNLIAHRPELARTLLKENDSAAALASISNDDTPTTPPRSTSRPSSSSSASFPSSSSGSPRLSDSRRSSSSTLTTNQNRLLESYKREASKRAKELHTYIRRWTEWTPDALPRLEVVPVATMVMDWEV